MRWLPACPASHLDGCVGVNHPYLPVQTPYQGRNLQVELAGQPLGCMPTLAWNQSTRCGVLHHAKQLLLPGKSAFACGLVLLNYSNTTGEKRKEALPTGSRSFLPLHSWGGYPERSFYEKAHQPTRGHC